VERVPIRSLVNLGSVPHQTADIVLTVRILHVITTVERGGAENHLLQIVSGQCSRGHSVEVAYLKGAGELAGAFQSVGAKVDKISGPRQALALSRTEFDVIHGHLPRAELLAVIIAGLRGSLVVSRHNAGPFWPGGPQLLSRVLSRLVDWRSRRIIVISRAVQEYLVSTGHSSRTQRLRGVPYGLATPAGQIPQQTQKPHSPETT
jgi:hypothetical protein